VNKHFHNSLSHTNGDANSEQTRLHRKVDRYHVQKIAEFAEKLEGFKEANGKSILHNSVIISGSSLGRGFSHDRGNLPVLLLGHGGGGIRGGHFLERNGISIYIT